ncbi:hypothetical protein [Fredinandcohnia onubensis]|uniref:hypothetical protein n=1 Tax=Fredinandcohnia onubensis TaxID=1571209 RepID=UPI0011565DA1|nr:hypothetical protein [Fredinandcohnia onubensis]
MTQSLEIIETNQLLIKHKEEMLSFSRRVSKVGEEYLFPRFKRYDQVVCLRRNQKLFAFQLVQTFDVGDEKFVYFGPLFSRMSCFLALFMSYIQVLMEKNVGRKIHLLAEIENPEVLVLFKALFDDCAYPKFQVSDVPEKVKEKVQIFSKKLSHIYELDIEQLTSKSIDSLYQYKSTYPEVENWLYSRKVDLSQGVNVVLYSAIPDDPNVRDTFNRQLESGRKRMLNWKEGKKEVLDLFEGGVVSNV